jgi:hypothetical protein
VTRLPRPGRLGPLAGYCRHRLADDPHIRFTELLEEITGLGYGGTAASALSGSLRSHGIRRAPCIQCPSPGLALTGKRWTCPVSPEAQLPRPARPLPGEMLTSYLTRLAAANHLNLLTLLALLPPWATYQLKHHRARPPASGQQPAAETLDTLARLTGAPPAALARALPVFGGGPASPARAVTACHRCAAARGITRQVPVHQPAWQMICARHRIWLPRPGQPQLDISRNPDIIIAAHRARRLLRRYTPQQLIFAQLEAAATLTGTAGPSPDTSAAGQMLAKAAAYPEIIAVSADLLRTRANASQ